jgi:hypothetical protein
VPNFQLDLRLDGRIIAGKVKNAIHRRRVLLRWRSANEAHEFTKTSEATNQPRNRARL